MQQQETFTIEEGSSAKGLAGELREQVSEGVEGLAAQAQGAVESGKERLVEGATGVARALHRASENLRADEQEAVGEYTEAVARKVEEVARFLESRDLPSMAREVSGFARRQPALFLGGAFTLGIVAARFMKSSSSGNAAGPVSGQRPERNNGDRQHASSFSYRATADESPDAAVTAEGEVAPLSPPAGGGL